MPSPLIFKPMHLPDNIQQAWAFRHEALPGFNPTTQLRWQTTADYAAWLSEKQVWHPAAATHVWLNGELIGQVEFGPSKAQPRTVGHVSFYYVVPHQRGNGYGRELVSFTENIYRSLGYTAMQLNTTPANTAARRFYAKNGFTERGPRPDKPEFLLLEKPL